MNNLLLLLLWEKLKEKERERAQRAPPNVWL
jgi:hypothetical protein